MTFLRSVKLIDENGVEYGVKHIDNKPRIVASPYLLEIKQGNILNHIPLDRFGSNRNVGLTEELLWIKTGVYTYLTAAEILKAKSTDVTDAGTVVTSGTATGGTTTTLVDTGATFVTNGVAVGDIVLNDTKEIYGIIKTVDSEIQLTFELATSVATVSTDAYRVVTYGSTGAAVLCLQGLDANYASQINFVVLNGTTLVATGSSFLRLFRTFVIGSKTNVGLIDGFNNAGTNTLSRIAIGNGQSLQATYTVPAGKELNLLEWYGSTINAKDTNFFLYIREIGESFRVKRVSVVKDDHFRLNLDMTDTIPEKTDIEMRVFCEVAGGIVAGGFWGWLE